VYHDNSDCPYGQEIKRNDNDKPGKNGRRRCDWCSQHACPDPQRPGRRNGHPLRTAAVVTWSVPLLVGTDSHDLWIQTCRARRRVVSSVARHLEKDGSVTTRVRSRLPSSSSHCA